jgi:L-histidine N-alpha-methyltransferase
MPTTPPLAVDVHLGPDDLVAGLREEVRIGLRATPKELSPTWLYDDAGCALYEEITLLPEYYPARAERSILVSEAAAIAAWTRADTFVELGSGSCEKSRVILGALADAGTLRRYAPFDVAEPTLRSAAMALLEDHPDIVIEGVVGDFRQHLHALPTGGRRLFAVLGGTIGNLRPDDRAQMLTELREGMEPGDALLLGTDLVKDRRRLVAAYDDAAGVTAAFNLNVLARLNRELGANFDLGAFTHIARFDEEHEWIEMRLRSERHQRVRVEALDLDVTFAAGEEMRTEISAKFRPERVCRELDDAGLSLVRWWTDVAGDFALSLSVR